MSAVLPPTDARALALARLQASRERLLHEMQPGLDGRPLHWIEHPWRVLRRWWRRARPAVAAAEWLQASSGTATALHDVGDLALTGGRRWVRQHPLAGMALAGVLGALFVYKRGAVWGLALGIGQGVLRQGQGWLLRRISDPALFTALLAALMAKAAPPDKDER